MTRIHRGSHREPATKYLTGKELEDWHRYSVRLALWRTGWDLYGPLILPYFGA